MRLVNDSRKTTVLWLVRILSALGLLILPLLELLHTLPLPGIFFGLGILAAAAFCGGWYLPAYFLRYAVGLDNAAVCICHGVWFRRRTVLPSAQILTVSVAATPLMRLLKLRLIVLGLPTRRVRLFGIRADAVSDVLALCAARPAP